MKCNGISRRYAKSLLDASLVIGEDLEILYKQLSLLRDYISDNSHLRFVLESKVISSVMRMKLWESISDYFNLSKLANNMVLLLIKNSRTYLLNHIIECFHDMKLDYCGITQVKVTLPVIINDNIKLESIKEEMSGYFPFPVQLDFIYDKSIIAGIIVDWNSFRADFSIRAKLDKIRSHMLDQI